MEHTLNVMTRDTLQQICSNYQASMSPKESKRQHPPKPPSVQPAEVSAAVPLDYTAALLLQPCDSSTHQHSNIKYIYIFPVLHKYHNFIDFVLRPLCKQTMNLASPSYIVEFCGLSIIVQINGFRCL